MIKLDIKTIFQENTKMKYTSNKHAQISLCSAMHQPEDRAHIVISIHTEKNSWQDSALNVKKLQPLAQKSLSP